MGRTLSSGALIAGRYELQDLVSERFSSSSWRAHDSVLERSVGIQAISVDDERVPAFLAAAKVSATVTDPRFLRVLDIIESFEGHSYIIREWARAYPLDHLLNESPLSNVRAAQVVQEVAEALGHAHELKVYHRYLTPHGVLLKRNGAVRISGLATAAALAGHFDASRVDQYERHDVDSIGWLLYACLTGRWPGGPMEGLRAAPRDHGRLLRPRQVVAGVSRDVDAICDRILGEPPAHQRTPLREAYAIAQALRGAGVDPAAGTHPGPNDVIRLDPVVRPTGPPPGVAPPRPRPRVLEPAPPTVMERGRQQALSLTRGHRALIAAGIVMALLLGAVLAVLATRVTTGSGPQAPQPQRPSYEIVRVIDFDPLGDGQENPELTALVHDGDPETGWVTSEYYNRPDLGGLKPGVGLIVDLGAPRHIGAVRIRLGGGTTDLELYATRTDVVDPPASIDDLVRLGQTTAADEGVSFSATEAAPSRYLVIWLTRLPEVSPDTYRGEVREIVVEPRQ